MNDTDDVEKLVAGAVDALCSDDNNRTLEQWKHHYLGKKSEIGVAISALKTMQGEEKRQRAAILNLAKARLENAYTRRQLALQEERTQQRLEEETLDVTLPGRGRSIKSLHPLSRSLLRIEQCFAGLGFEVATGPELESAFYNFTSLNMPEQHPARSMHDTFYLDTPGMQLRTHTSPIQTRYMRHHAKEHAALRVMPDIRIIAPGWAYRVDSDATHSPMFHQLEGLWVSSTSSFANLKWVIQAFLQAFFEATQLDTRFRPSFFPFTEPSAEVDLAFSSGPSKGKWLEIGGCGMVHPKVLQMCGIDPEAYQGFAFGMGVDRLTMLRYGIDDLRSFYEGDLRFLRQFS